MLQKPKQQMIWKKIIKLIENHKSWKNSIQLSKTNKMNDIKAKFSGSVKVLSSTVIIHFKFISWLA